MRVLRAAPAAVVCRITIAHLSRVFRDTVGFCGAEIIRRVIGFARPADFTTAARQVRLLPSPVEILMHPRYPRR